MPESKSISRGFASDNNSGVHPEVLEAIVNANYGHCIGYGDDRYTKQALEIFRNIFGKGVDVYFVLTGTGANTLGLTAGMNSFNGIICPETAHINLDECGAPEKFSGGKILPVKSSDGKIKVEDIEPFLHSKGFEHHIQPRIVSISQPTEMGTVYQIEEIRELARFAHKHEMLLHMDGARISNAAVALDKSFEEFTLNAGVDILSFGGTKNGLMYGETVIFKNPELSRNFKYLRKQGMQLASKMRYIAAQYIAWFNNDLWRRNATNANYMANLLKTELSSVSSFQLTQKVETNGVFITIPAKNIDLLQKHYYFYIWNHSKSEVRLMTSWDTKHEDVEDFGRIARSLT